MQASKSRHSLGTKPLNGEEVSTSVGNWAGIDYRTSLSKSQPHVKQASAATSHS